MPARRRRAPTKPRKKQQVARKQGKEEEEESGGAKIGDAQDDAEGWYSIRCILKEKRVKSGVRYLVDWDDNAVSGEKYPPSWTKEVTPAALEEWEALKRAPASAPLPAPREAHRLPAQLPPGKRLEKGQELDPAPQSVKWHHLFEPSWDASGLTRRPSASPSSSVCERCRSIQRAELPEDPGLDFTPTPSVYTASEVFDRSYQDLDGISEAAADVAISQKSDLDPDEYPSVADSKASPLPLTELDVEDGRIAVRPLSQRTIPDSQDDSGHYWSVTCAVDTQSPAFSGHAAPVDPGESSPPPPLPAREEHVPASAVDLPSHPSNQPNSEHPAVDIDLAQDDSRAASTPLPDFGPALSTDTNLSPSVSQGSPGLPASASSSYLPGNQGPEGQSQSRATEPRDAQRASPALDAATSLVHRASGEALIMDATSRGDAAPQHQMSAKEELSRLLGLEPDTDIDTGPAPPSSVQDDLERQEQEAPSEPVPRFQSQADMPTQPSMTVETSSIEVGKSAWTPNAAPGSPKLRAGHSASPSVVAGQPRPSAAQELLQKLDLSFDTPSADRDSLPTVGTPDLEPITVSPADMARQDELSLGDASVLPLPSLLRQEPVTARLYEAPSASSSQEDAPKSVSSDLSMPPQDLALEATVTLPLQASLRPMYDSVLKEYKRAITDFSDVFESGESGDKPDESVTKRIDELFGRLHNLCDHPVDVSGTTLEYLPPRDIAKYCCDVNAKFSFVFEFLQLLRARSRILVVARSPELLRLIHHLASALQLDCSGEAIDDSGEHKGSRVQVVLALATEQIDPSTFDVVIGYDSSFLHSGFMQRCSPRDENTGRQLVLKLVTTHTIEHIDLKVSELAEGLSHPERSLERKYVVLTAIVGARAVLNEPERGYLEPHEVAEVFAQSYSRGEESIDWEPQPIPDELLEALLHSQGRSGRRSTSPELEIGRKRKHDSPSDSEAKRMRTFSLGESGSASHAHGHHPPLPDEVRELLEAAALKAYPARPGVMVQVPLSVLQVIAQQGSEYERRIKDASLDAEYKATITKLESRVKEYERTTSRIYKANRTALQDRARFEAETRSAEAGRKAAKDAADKEAEALRRKMQHLEETIARLTQDPDAADPDDTPLARSEKLLKEALDKVATLERRLENSQEDSSYMQSVYQEATSAAAALKAELDEVKARNEELGKKASDNAVRIQEIQANNATVLHVRQIEDLKAQVREREAEIGRVREEMKGLRNGRRETRGVSAPHSPRMGVMSPRVGRAYGSASRGTSPASVAGMDEPGTPFARQQPNPRWNHLRE